MWPLFSFVAEVVEGYLAKLILAVHENFKS
jgi:hypothetical protein